MINQKNRESGMALVFAVGLLALMLAIGIAFIGNSVNLRKSAENNSARTQSRMLAMSAINRAVASLMVYTHSYALANDADFPQHYRNIYSYTSGTAFKDGLLDKSKSPSLMRLPTDSSVVGEQVAMRHNLPFESGKWKGNWVFFRDGKGETNDRIIGRAAWQVIGSSAQILAPVFFRGGVTLIDPADDNFKANENRWGREIDEVYLTDTFTTLADQLGNGADSKVIGYETIYNALNTGNNLQKQRWAEKWFFPDSSESSTVGDPSMVLGENFSSIYNGHGVSLMRFNISEFWQGKYSKKPGGDIEHDSWQKAYKVGDNADQWYARLGIDTSKAVDLEKTNSELAITRLTADAQMMEGTFDYEIVTTATAEDEYSGLPYLRRIGTDKGTFADLGLLRKQIAANFNDYCDSDGVPTSDIAADKWVSELFGKAAEVDDGGNKKYQHPTYTGNEKTPYLYELGMNFALVPSDSAVNMINTEKQSDGTYLIKADLRLAPIFKLCNMYPFDPAAASASGTLYKDFAANDFLRAYADFDEMSMKFKLRKILLKGAKFTYTVKTVDSSTDPATETTHDRTLTCDLTVELNPAAGSTDPVTVLTGDYSYQGSVWKRAGAADADGTTKVKPALFTADEVKNSDGSKPYPVKYTANANDQSWQILEYKKVLETDKGFVIDHAFNNPEEFFTAATENGTYYKAKDGVSMDNVSGTGTVNELCVAETGENKTKTISNFTLSNVDSLHIQALQLSGVALELRRMMLTANVPLCGSDAERGVDYAGVSGKVEKTGLALDIDLTATAGVMPGFVVGAFCNTDPRQNLNKGDWQSVPNVGVLANYAIPTETEIQTAMKLGNVNSGTDGNNLSPQNLVSSPSAEPMDFEEATAPAYTGSDDNKRISTAIIRNAPMMSPWEIGFIHRGVKWQTVNLKNAGVTTFDDNGTVWDKTTRSSSYNAGDGGILEQIKMTDQVRTYGKINVNVLRPKHQDYCPEDVDIARALFRNLRYGEDPWIFLKNSTRQTNGTFPTAEDSGTRFEFSGSNSLAETAATNFVADVNRGTYSNRAAFLEYSHGDNALENAFGAVTDQATDARQEEIIGKTINLLDASYSSPSIINVLVVAQSIRDREGTQVAVAADEKAKYTSPDGAVSDFEDGIASKSCSIGKFDLYEHSENDDKNIYFDEITGEVKMFVTFERNQTTGRMRVLKVTYL